MKAEFFDRFSKNTRMSYFIKFHPMGAKMFHANGHTDMKQLTVAFLNFANVPKNTGYV